MDAREDILSQIPMDQLAAQVGADEETTRRAAEQLIPTLLGGMQANAADERGAASLFEALGQHQGDAPSLDQVDTQDGQSIVSHVFGANQDDVVSRIGGLDGGAGSGLIKKLLPILAPLVLNYLAGKVLGGGQGGQASAPPAGQPSGQAADSSNSEPSAGGLGDILGGMLGGSGGGLPGGLGEILGGVLGGGRK